MLMQPAPRLRFSRLWLMFLMLQALCRLQTMASAQAQPAPAAQPAPMPALNTVELDDSKGCVVPFSYDPPVHPFITVLVRINKSRPLPFIVDTGAQGVVFLMPWAAQELKLPIDKDTPQPPGGNVVLQHIATSCQVNILTLPGPKVDFNTPTAYVTSLPVFENATTPHIAGIIGNGIFRIATARLDFDKKTLTFFADKHAPLTPPRPAVSLPLVPTDPNCLCVNLHLQAGKSIPFELDTGNNSTVLPAGDATGLPRLAEGATTFDDAGGHHLLSEFLLPSLPLGDLSTPFVSVSLNPQAKQALLGLDVLSRFRVTIDTRNGFLTLEPRRRLSSLAGDADIMLAFRDGNTYLDKVLRQTDNPNIAAGDRLLAIDGVDMSGQTYVEAYLRLNGYAGTIATLVLEKENHQKVTVPWLRRSHFPTVIMASFGLALIKEANQPIKIITVFPNSEAENRGLKVGDEVLTVNGESTQSMPFSALETLFATDEHGATRLREFTLKRNQAETVQTFHLEKGSLHTP